ncbi:UNVERIFIED_ORG: putative membrane protein [Xanthomonas phage Xoo-sp15]
MPKFLQLVLCGLLLAGGTDDWIKDSIPSAVFFYVVGIGLLIHLFFRFLDEQ